jgi:hypothetical protein
MSRWTFVFLLLIVQAFAILLTPNNSSLGNQTIYKRAKNDPKRPTNPIVLGEF